MTSQVFESAVHAAVQDFPVPPRCQLIAAVGDLQPGSVLAVSEECER